MAQTLGTSGIFFDELDSSPTFDGNIQAANFVATQRGLGRWQDINAMISYIMAPTLVFGELFGVFAGSPFPDNANLRCIDFKIEPADTISGITSGGVNLHNFCFWTIKYSNIRGNPNQQGNQDPVAMLIHEYDVGGELFIPSGLKMAWGVDGTPVQGSGRGATFVPTVEMTITWPRIPYLNIPGDAIDSLRGKVNQFTVTFATGSCAPETLLFLGAKIRGSSMSDGTLSWDLSYKFSKRTVKASDAGSGTSYGIQGQYGGWNHFWREGGGKGGWYRVVRVFAGPDGTSSFYEYAPFNTLFPGTAQTW